MDTYRSNGGHGKPKVNWLALIIGLTILGIGIFLTANESTQDYATPFLIGAYCLYVLGIIVVGLWKIRRDR